MQVILDSSFARPGSAPICSGKKGEFRDWTIACPVTLSTRRFSKSAALRTVTDVVRMQWGV